MINYVLTWIKDSGLLRIRIELILILVLISTSWLLPTKPEDITPQWGLLSLIITKFFGVTLGVLYAHASRKFLFDYLNLKELITEHHWGGIAFMSVWYGVIIWAFATGG